MFLWHHYNVNEYDFFNLMKDQNIQNKKCKGALQTTSWKIIYFLP